jgi:hypothetical protein
MVLHASTAILSLVFAEDAQGYSAVFAKQHLFPPPWDTFADHTPSQLSPVQF